MSDLTLRFDRCENVNVRIDRGQIIPLPVRNEVDLRYLTRHCGYYRLGGGRAVTGRDDNVG